MIKQRPGNTALVAIIIVLALAVGGYFLYTSMNQQSPTNNQNTTTNTYTQNTNTDDLGVAEAPTISSTDDLTLAESVMMDADLEAGAELEAMSGYAAEF